MGISKAGDILIYNGLGTIHTMYNEFIKEQPIYYDLVRSRGVGNEVVEETRYYDKENFRIYPITEQLFNSENECIGEYHYYNY